MTDISRLLNPLPEALRVRPNFPPTPQTSANNTPEPSSSQKHKRVKLSRDAPIFIERSIVGDCRFPPDETQDAELAVQHQQFSIHPFGRIADYPRHIPYSSCKNHFSEKTMKDGFQVFQYTFRKPGDYCEYAMLWDYNIGLVRTTPLFKCMGVSKTTSAKMLKRNPGLKEISYSITGGALIAQGYWVPWEAARAIAATFCWEIRYALTPVFGIAFPGMCIPKHQVGFGRMEIDPQIIQNCTHRAEQFRNLELQSRRQNSRSEMDYEALATESPTPSDRIQSTSRTERDSDTKNSLQTPKVTDTYPKATKQHIESNLATNPSLSVSSTNRAYKLFESPRSIPDVGQPLFSSTDTVMAVNDDPFGCPSKERSDKHPQANKLSSPEISPKTIPATLKRRSSQLETEADDEWFSSLPENVQGAYLLLSLRYQQSPAYIARTQHGIKIPMMCSEQKEVNDQGECSEEKEVNDQGGWSEEQGSTNAEDTGEGGSEG